MRYNLAALYFKYCLVVATARWIPAANLASGISRLILAEGDDLKFLYLGHRVARASSDLYISLERPLVGVV